MILTSARNPLAMTERPAAQAKDACERLERGEILILDGPSIPIDSADHEMLMGIPASGVTHKNVSFAPASRTLRGVRGDIGESVGHALGSYSDHVIQRCRELLGAYHHSWRIELASFRPIEEQGRVLRHRERNDLLHIDAYPGRPTNGARILRFFSNINPSRDRVWVTSQPLHLLAEHHRFRELMHKAIVGSGGSWRDPLTAMARSVGIAFPRRSPYDRAMLRLHNAMKDDEEFQAACPKFIHRFAPGESWMVFTDALPHAVLEGQFALEQSFFIPREGLLMPHLSPLAVLENLAGRSMVDG